MSSKRDGDIKMTSLRIPKKMHHLLKEISFYSGQSMNQIILSILSVVDLEEMAAYDKQKYEASQSEEKQAHEVQPCR